MLKASDSSLSYDDAKAHADRAHKDVNLGLFEIARKVHYCFISIFLFNLSHSISLIQMNAVQPYEKMLSIHNNILRLKLIRLKSETIDLLQCVGIVKFIDHIF